jgi:hypothetical protein
MQNLIKLFEWHGYKSGGVKIPFTDRGKPTSITIETDLINMLNVLVSEMLTGKYENALNVFFVGGPGNGKTEALEYFCLKAIEGNRNFDELLNQLQEKSKKAGRIIEIAVNYPSFNRIKLVPDASVSYSGSDPATSMMEDLKDIEDPLCLYVCCINRGILHDVTEKAEVHSRNYFSELLEINSNTLEVQSNSWPSYLGLEDRKVLTAVWPMERSSLFGLNDNRISPFQQIIQIALREYSWNEIDTDLQNAGFDLAYNPFKVNVDTLLLGEAENIRKIVETYELLENRRLTFREVLAFVSYLLLGFEEEYHDTGFKLNPERRVKHLLETFRDNNSEVMGFVSCFKLAMMQTEFRLFRRWPDLSEVVGDQVWKKYLEGGRYPAILAFCQIFSSNHEKISKTDVYKLIEYVGENLDPSLIDSESSETFGPQYLLNNVDVLLQSSVSSLVPMLADLEFFSKLDSFNLLFFSCVESELDAIKATCSKSRIIGIVERLTILLKKITSVYVKRKIGAVNGITPYTARMSSYSVPTMDDYFKQLYSPIESLLGIQRLYGTSRRFGKLKAGLNSTFGQPARGGGEIYFIGEIQYTIRIYKIKGQSCRQPVSNLLYLKLTVITENELEKLIILPFTFKFYNAVYDLRRGLKKGTVPREVTATFDRMRSFLEGVMVHKAIEGSLIVFPSKREIEIEST